MYGADSATILLLVLPYEADSAANLPLILLYEADHASILLHLLKYDADSVAILDEPIYDVDFFFGVAHCGQAQLDSTPVYTCSLIKKFLVLLPWDGSHGLRCCVRHEFYEIVFPADAGRHNSENRHKAFLMKIITFRTPKATPNPPDMNWPLGPHPLKKCC